MAKQKNLSAEKPNKNGEHLSIGRLYKIGEKEYMIYRDLTDKRHILVKLNGEIVYSNRKTTKSVSIWLKQQKKLIKF